MASLSILGKVVPEKVLFLNKKAFWIKIFKFDQFLNHFLYHASYFESRSSNASDLEPFFHNSTKFESKKLERVTLRKKVLQRIRFWSEIDLNKNRLWWLFSFQKVIFWIFLAHENANFCSYAFSQKIPFGEKNWRKNSFPPRLLKRIRFWNNFLTTVQTLNQENQNTSEF